MQLAIISARNNGRPLPPWMIEEAGRATGLSPPATDGAMRELGRSGLFQWTDQGWIARPTVPARGLTESEAHVQALARRNR